MRSSSRRHRHASPPYRFIRPLPRFFISPSPSLRPRRRSLDKLNADGPSLQKALGGGIWTSVVFGVWRVRVEQKNLHFFRLPACAFRLLAAPLRKNDLHFFARAPPPPFRKKEKGGERAPIWCGSPRTTRACPLQSTSAERARSSPWWCVSFSGYSLHETF